MLNGNSVNDPENRMHPVVKLLVTMYYCWAKGIELSTEARNNGSQGGSSSECSSETRTMTYHRLRTLPPSPMPTPIHHSQ